jgi:cytochrome b561
MTSLADRHPAGVDSYSGIAKLLHWIIALSVLIMVPIGLIMGRIASGDVQNLLYHLHRSFGVLVLALMLVRLLYRVVNSAPPPEPTLTGLQRAVSHLVHLALYALIIAQGLIGWVATSAYGADIWVFGLFIMPNLVAKDQSLAEPLFAVHDVLGFVVAGLLAMHIGAALFHHFIRKDGVLRRMLP